MINSKNKNKTFDSSDPHEIHYVMNSGDAFLSFHLDETKCLGICFEKNKDWRVDLKNFLISSEKYFGTKLDQVEVKLIGEESTIKKIGFQLPINLQKKCKELKIATQFELLFIPSKSRVRIKSEPISKPAEKINLLIVDDSKTIRNILSSIFSSDDQINVVGSLEHPKLVDDFLMKNKVDVITLDIHMPEMDGVELLKKIYPKFKIPCVMISSVSMSEGSKVFEALENGAVDYIQKPEAHEIDNLRPFFIEKVKVAATTKNRQIKSKPGVVNRSLKQVANLDTLIVLGSSTGGTEAIREILTKLPDKIPPMLIVQHIPPVFSEAFAKRMNELCKFEVKEAVDGDEVIPNRVLIAPGGKQMKFISKGGKNFVEINLDEPVNRFRPSVDYMFFSVADNKPKHIVGVLLTGMGKDGALGLKRLRDLGAYTIAQDEASSVVFGMPKEAIAIGGADFVEDIHNIANKIIECTHEPAKIRESSQIINLKKISGL